MINCPLLESMEEIGKNISKSYESWNTANKRLSSGKVLIRRSEEIKRLGAKTKHLPENLKRDTATLIFMRIDMVANS